MKDKEMIEEMSDIIFNSKYKNYYRRIIWKAKK